MTIVVSVLAVTFAAFCVWLGVRIINRRERWARWTAVALVALLVAYPLSCPWVWIIFVRVGEPAWAEPVFGSYYAPYSWALRHAPESVQRWEEKYSFWCISDGGLLH